MQTSVPAKVTQGRPRTLNVWSTCLPAKTNRPCRVWGDESRWVCFGIIISRKKRPIGTRLGGRDGPRGTYLGRLPLTLYGL